MMKVSLSLIVIQYDKNKNSNEHGGAKVYFTDENNLPSIFASTKNEKETLKSLCEKYFKLSFEWLEKQLYDFRIVNNNGNMIAESVYIIYTPEVVDSTKSGKFLSFSQIHELGIKLEPFYERAITGSGRQIFR